MGDPLELLLTRRSIGKLRPDPVPRVVLEEILQAATTAPNHHLTEPWRFIVLTGAARRTIGRAHAAAVARVRPETAPDALAREEARLERAPAVVVCVAAGGSDDPVRRREDRDAVAAAVQNLLLAAHGLGLAGMWRTGAMVDEPEVASALGLTDGDEIVAFVYLGWPAATPPKRARRPLGDVVAWRDR